MSYPTTVQEFGEYSGIFKKIKKRVKKIVRKVVTVQAGIVTGGLIKPKLLGIKSKGAVKLYKKTGKIARVVAIAAGVAVALPMAATYFGAAKGTTTFGALKFFGGKLVSAPKNLLDKLTGKGINPSTASIEDVLKAGVETGAITPGMWDQLGNLVPGINQALRGGDSLYPGGTDFPSRPEEDSVSGTPETQQGFLSGLPTWALPVGVGLGVIVLMKGRK